MHGIIAVGVIYVPGHVAASASSNGVMHSVQHSSLLMENTLGANGRWLLFMRASCVASDRKLVRKPYNGVAGLHLIKQRKNVLMCAHHRVSCELHLAEREKGQVSIN